MAPSPLRPSVVHVLLQYIAPPSGLAHPLPPNLISTPLLQRHHFLSLSPDTPQDYLCWPALLERQARALDLLESLPRPVHDEPVDFPVQYSFDGENAYAHVDLTTPGDEVGARLVFQWDDADGWKYHDTTLMPFPSGSHTNVEDAFVSAHGLGAAEQPASSPYPIIVAEGDPGSPAGAPDDSDDDDYWNAYGSHDHDRSSSRATHTSGKDAPGSEDAYWAQYSSVHGSADSTHPSPLPQPHRKVPLGQRREGNDVYSAFPLPSPLRTESRLDDVLPIPNGAMLRPDTRSKYDPASPRQLTQRLEAISLQNSRPATPPLIADAGSVAVSPTVTGSAGSDRLETPSSAVGWAASLDVSRPARPSLVIQALSAATSANVDSYGELALRESIKGIWKLWKAGRQSENGLSVGEEDREAFLVIVRDTIEHS